ncbi:MAG TPA: response regulator [Spirochaetota bacterium]|nr:response regulator [Spirochaetota bacterium]HOD15528.1 response regulator [Spirochaetota bacterium]HPG51500.1 response regulator [Spirochaetota bacterium]HPN11968.1 response regulator [Spirochaetota bacterium]HQL82526.1 response regulator [Spirochaetota bacterium]
MADKKKILVIDDDVDITDSIKAILVGNGFDAFTASDGKSGLEAVDTVKPDLVLCDMMMEQVDAGSRVAHEIRKKDRKLPVYLLSSIGAATAQNVELDKLGFNGVFQKPISPDHMIKTIKKALHMA